jgi:hypothetical protein
MMVTWHHGFVKTHRNVQYRVSPQYKLQTLINNNKSILVRQLKQICYANYPRYINRAKNVWGGGWAGGGEHVGALSCTHSLWILRSNLWICFPFLRDSCWKCVVSLHSIISQSPFSTGATQTLCPATEQWSRDHQWSQVIPKVRVTILQKKRRVTLSIGFGVCYYNVPLKTILAGHCYPRNQTLPDNLLGS